MISSRSISVVSLLIFSALQIQCASRSNSVVTSKASEKQAENLPNESPSRIPVSRAAGYFHFILGELASLDSNSEVALQHFQFASQFYPDSDYIQLQEAEQLVGLGKVSEAKSILNKISLTEEPDYFLLKARVAAMELHFNDSKTYLDKAISIFSAQSDDRKVRETILMKVALLSDAHQFEDALESLDQYLKDSPDDEIAHYFRGKILSAQELTDEAIQAFQRALELRPSFSAAARALGLLYEINDRNDDAIKTYQEALFFNPEDTFFRQKLANLYLIQENYPKALEQFQQLSLLTPDDSQILFRTALIHFKLEQYSEAEALFERLLTFDTIAHDRINYYLAAIYQEQAQFEGAVESYQQIEADSPYYIESRLKSSLLATEYLKNPKLSYKILEEALTQKPEVEELWLALSSHQEKSNDLKEAINTLKRGVKNLPKSERLLFVLGSLQDKSGEMDASIATMEKLLEINPNHAHALNHIGYLLAEKGVELDRAESLLIKAVQLEPQNAYITDSLGWVYYKKGDYYKAREIIEKANQLEANEPVLMEHLADVYKKLGLEKDALRVYRKIVAINEEREKNSGTTPELSEQSKRVQAKIASAVADSSL